MLSYDPEKHIDITGVDLRELTKQAYALSEPKGLGILHFQSGSIPEEMLNEVMTQPKQDYSPVVLRLDYVSGRACKLTVYEVDDRLFMSRHWYDHTDDQLRLLLASCGITPPENIGGKHDCCCECIECKKLN